MSQPPYDPDKLPPDLRKLLPSHSRSFASHRKENVVSPQGQTKQVSQKSYAQVASSVSPQVAPVVAPNSMAGLRPRPADREAWVSYGVKLKRGELNILRAKAKGLGLSVNAYIRAKALGEDYIQKPPSWLRDILLKLYVELAAQGNNLNQLAHRVNKNLASAEAALITANRQRMPVLKTLEKVQMALAGRRPPNDY
jgi:hypothetical protein